MQGPKKGFSAMSGKRVQLRLHVIVWWARWCACTKSAQMVFQCAGCGSLAMLACFLEFQSKDPQRLERGKVRVTKGLSRHVPSSTSQIGSTACANGDGVDAAAGANQAAMHLHAMVCTRVQHERRRFVMRIKNGFAGKRFVWLHTLMRNCSPVTGGPGSGGSTH